MVCSAARRKELNLTSKMRAARAGPSGLRQERFHASSYDIDTSCTLMRHYMRNFSSFSLKGVKLKIFWDIISWPN